MEYRKNRKGTILMSMGLLLLAAALALTVYNLWDSHRANEAAKAAAGELRRQIPDKTPSGEEAALQDGQPDYVQNPKMEMPVVYVDGNAYIGLLSIPSLGLELPVMSEWSYPNLKIAPCRYSGSAYLGNMVIAAHNYSRHFQGIANLGPGDEVFFTDADGNRFSYRVGETEILAPTAIDEMKESGWSLSLFTCTYGGQTRVTVRCE